MKVLFIDGYNLLHRSRYGMGDGNYNIVYTFFRSLRALVGNFSPDKVVLVLEGHPKFRYDLYPNYKANRKIDPGNEEKQNSYLDFKRQKDLIIDLLSFFPIELLKHPDFEGDDLIGKLVSAVYQNDEVIIITGDTDFNQLLTQTNVKIYNPIKKEFVVNDFNQYLYHKALVGDTSDNIDGIPRIGKKTAEKLLKLNNDEFMSWLDADANRRIIFERNLKLIKFADVSLNNVINLHREENFPYVKEKFKEMGFNSLINEQSWQKFINTFNM